VTSNFPINAATVNTSAIDLSQVSAFPLNESFSIILVTTAGTNGANNKNVTFQLQSSNVNTSANFTNVPGIGPVLIAEVAAGYAATTFNISTPPDARQFLRVQIKTEVAGGNPNDATLTMRLQF